MNKKTPAYVPAKLTITLDDCVTREVVMVQGSTRPFVDRCQEDFPDANHVADAVVMQLQAVLYNAIYADRAVHVHRERRPEPEPAGEDARTDRLWGGAFRRVWLERDWFRDALREFRDNIVCRSGPVLTSDEWAARLREVLGGPP